MVTNALKFNTGRKVRVRGITLPNEHGSWGFLFEPLVAVIAIAPSIGGLWISLLVILAFLIRQPLKTFIINFHLGRNPLEMAVAYKFILLYGAISSIGLVGSMIYGKAEIFLPFALIAPLALFQIYCDVNKKSRSLLPELTGAIAISSSAAVIALAGGWSFEMAFALWGVFIARLIPSIIYVRNRLRLEKGKEFSVVSQK